MARVTLVAPPFDDKRDRSAYYCAPPVGLLLIASYLEKSGFQVSVIDFVHSIQSGLIEQSAEIYSDCMEQILATEPDLVAFSTQCSTGPSSVNIAQRLASHNNNITIVFGGHDVSFIGMEYLKRFEFIDYVLSGEGELTTPRLCDAILCGKGALADIPGLVWRNGGRVIQNNGVQRVENLDELLPPAYHLVPEMSSYFSLSRQPVILIDSGRGCSFRCEFCQTALLSGKGVRYRSVGSIIEELRRYVCMYGPFEAYFVHDLFTAKLEFVQSLCNALLIEKLPITWQCRCRLDQVTPELLSLMSRAGCTRLLYGVESGSSEILDTMNKKIRSSGEYDTLERVRWTIDAGILPSLSMVIGTPEESFEDLDSTMRLASDFTNLGTVNAFIQLMSPLPGTALTHRIRDRLEYVGDLAPTAFSQGIEFDCGRRLEEDEQLVSSNPTIFSSFQVVVPNHGDLQLCVDVSTAYCKLLEVFRFSYERICRSLSMSHLVVFNEFRNWVVARTEGSGFGSRPKDFEIWAFFSEYIKNKHADLLERDIDLKLVFYYELHVQRIAEATPVEVPMDIGPDWGDAYFSIHPAAFVISSSGRRYPWEENKVGESSSAYAVYMTQDRLRRLRLSNFDLEALRLLRELNLMGFGNNPLYERIRKILTTLDHKGLFTNEYRDPDFLIECNQLEPEVAIQQLPLLGR